MSKARDLADQVSNLISISSGGSNFITPQILSASLSNIDLSLYATNAQLSASVANIDVTSSLDSRIFISSASPTSGNTNGRIWIDPSTASSPVVSIYGSGSWNSFRQGRVKAIGGTKYNFGAYTVHAITGSDNFIAYENLTCDILVVGGGGAGGPSYGDNDTGKGGGGAGGILYGAARPVNAGTYAISIGSGGAGRTNGNNTTPPAANNGGDTIAFSVTANGGGGGGGSDNQQSPRQGGSGGGAGARNNSSNDTAAVSNQGTFSGWTKYGNSGGNSANGNFGGGGGGGAGGNGQTYSGPANDSVGGNGGVGIDFSATFGATYGVSGWFGGGGGGGSYATGSLKAQSSGGTGGGGNGISAREYSSGGQFSVTNINGTANTGGGGGGSSEDAGIRVGAGSSSGSGGSGIVLIRYLT
jgi:hypothetical protein